MSESDPVIFSLVPNVIQSEATVQWWQRQSILQNELADKTALAADLSESNGVTTAIIRRKAQGDFTSDWARNKSIQESDHTCVYRFDSASKRLEGLQVNITVDGREVTVRSSPPSVITRICHRRCFSLHLQATVTHHVDTAEMKDAAVTLNGPKERWDDLLAVMPMSRVPDGIKKCCGGLQVISLGEPFQSGIYAGYFVPYQVRMPDGSIKTHTLAMRNDNPHHRWVWDGGL